MRTPARLKLHLMPAFGDRPVGTITKAEILAFRARLAAAAIDRRPGKLH